MFFPNLSIVFLVVNIEDVGLTANETIISCPVEIPPKIPPALLDLNFTFPDLLLQIMLSGLIHPQPHFLPALRNVRR